LALDSLANVLVTGYTTSTKFPVFCNSFDQKAHLDDDAFISKLSPRLDSLIASTYIGGRGSDHSYAIDLNQGDSVFIAGYTTSEDFPVFNAFDTTFHGGPSDGFVLLIDPELDQVYPCCTELTYPQSAAINLPTSLTLEWAYVNDAISYLIKFRSSSFNTNYDQLIIDAGNNNSFDVTDLPCGDTIHVQIQPVNDNGLVYENNEVVFQCEPVWFVISEHFFEIQNTSICEGESYEWFGADYNSEGSYVKNFTSNSGCDSIYQLDLEVHSTYFSSEDAEICDTEDFLWQGVSYELPGTYYKHFVSAEGCDSTFELNLTVHQSYFESMYTTICEGDTFNWAGLNLDLPGTYTQTFLSSYLCDSIVQLNLEVEPVYSFYETLTICEGEVLNWHGSSLSTEGSYVADYQSNSGCDSLYFLELNTYPAYFNDETANICQGENYTWQGMLLDSAGFYTANYNTILGCDSSFQLLLIQSEPDTTVTVSSDTLFVNYDDQSNYQWVTCPDMVEIPGAVESTYVADSSGSYAVIVEINSCIDTSACQTIIHSKLNHTSFDYSLSIFPNPANGKILYVPLSSYLGSYQVAVVNMDGKILLNEKCTKEINNIDISILTPGFYFVRVKIGNQTISKKLIVAD